jgi:hypothetical protein
VRREKWAKVKERIESLPPARPPVEKEPPPWRGILSTPRARLSKQRRRRGLHCVTVLVSEEHLDALIKLDWLPREERASPNAIQKGLSAYLYSTLVERYVHMLWAKMAREQRLAARSRGRPQPPLSPEPGP